MPFAGGTDTRIANPKWRTATAAILENLKIVICRPRLERFWRNLACSSTLLTVPTVKNLKFQKSKMAAVAILKNPKSRYLDNGLTDRHEIWHGDVIRHQRCVPQLEICNFKNITRRKPPFWKIEKSPYLGRILSDFNEIWQGDAVEPSWPLGPLQIWNL